MSKRRVRTDFLTSGSLGFYNVINDTLETMLTPAAITTAEVITVPNATGTMALANGADNQIPVMNGTTAFDYSSSLTFDGTILKVPALQVTGGTGDQGKITWNSDEETIDIVLNGSILQAGQENHYHVNNNSGVTIPDGYGVMATGTLGSSGRILVAKMVNDNTVHPKYFLGIATESIANDTTGKVATFGKLREIQTDGVNFGETWVDGDLIYLSPTTAGYLTKVQPEAPAYKGPIGIVIKSHATAGTIQVRVQGNEGIHDLHDVHLSSIANKDVIRWNSTNERFENYSSTNWDTAYDTRIATFTTNNNSGAATFTSNTLNIPNYTLSGLGGQPQLNGTGFVKASGTTISYDNSTYDNYSSWNLQTNGVQRINIVSGSGGTGGKLDIQQGTNIGVSYGAGGVVTINNTATGGMTWQAVTGNTTAVGNNGYIANSATRIVFTIPSTNTVETIRITGKGTGGWQVNVPGSWTLIFVDEIITDNIQSTTSGDSVELLCIGNNKWQVISSTGNITFNNL